MAPVLSLYIARRLMLSIGAAFLILFGLILLVDSVDLIRNMQIFCVLSLLFCVISMFALFAGWIPGGQCTFAIALILMMISMGISLRELIISVGALDLLLADMEQHEKMG